SLAAGEQDAAAEDDKDDALAESVHWKARQDAQTWRSMQPPGPSALVTAGSHRPRQVPGFRSAHRALASTRSPASDPRGPSGRAGRDSGGAPTLPAPDGARG